MIRKVLLTSLCLAPLALADAKEDAQKKVDEAMAKSCELAKKALTDAKATCVEEYAAIEKVDCAVKEQRKSADFLKLNGDCQKKIREGVKAGAAKKEEKKEEAAAAPADAAKKKGSHCKVKDEAGAVVAEHDSEGGSIKCMGEIREKVKAEKCEPGKKLAYQFFGETNGKEHKPTGMNITCPKK